MEKRWQGNGVETILLGLSKEGQTELACEGIKGSSRVKIFGGEFRDRGNVTCKNPEAGAA